MVQDAKEAGIDVDAGLEDVLVNSRVFGARIKADGAEAVASITLAPQQYLMSVLREDKSSQDMPKPEELDKAKKVLGSFEKVFEEKPVMYCDFENGLITVEYWPGQPDGWKRENLESIKRDPKFRLIEYEPVESV